MTYAKYSNMFLLLFIACLQTACAANKVRLIADYPIETGRVFNKSQIGGLSGIAFDAKTNTLLSISDDAWVDQPRLFEFDFQLTEKSFSVTPKNVIYLKNSKNKNFLTGTIDFEDLTLAGNEIYASSEGNKFSLLKVHPEIYVYNREGKFIRFIDVPEKFINKDNKSGVRENMSFESLTSTKEGDVLFVANEQGLLQDAEVTTKEAGSTVRIIKYKNDQAVAEYPYLLDKLEDKTGDNGLVAMVALNENSLFTLERSYLNDLKKNVIRVYKVDLSNATEVSHLAGLKNQNYQVAKKELVVDFKDIVDAISDKKLDNMEAMTLGPILPNGNPTLIFVSDNNFSKHQKTLFIALEVVIN